MSLAQAASIAGTSKSALAHWEAERRCPSGEALSNLLAAYGVSDRERAGLLTRADPPYARVALSDETRGPAPSVGEFVRAMRLRRRLTQMEVAYPIGVAQSTVARWERGEIEADPGPLDAALLAMGASADEIAAVASLDPAQRPTQDLEERYERIAKGPHELGETLWIGLEADLWWRSTESDVHDRMLQTVIGHRADWYALALRPQETVPLARRAIKIGFGPPSDVPQGIAYGIVHATIQMRADPVPALRTLKGWSARLRTAGSRARVQALKGLLIAELDEALAIDTVREARRLAGDDGEAHAYANRMLARVHLRHENPTDALRTLEDDDHIDGLTIRALALARLGEEPPEDWMEAIRERPATRQIPMYRERLDEIVKAMDRHRRE